MSTQQIVIDVAGESAGVAGVARTFEYSKISPTPPLVTLSIDDNTGITTWAWQILAQPEGASAVLGTPTSSVCTFTPTAYKYGTYLIACTLNGTIEVDRNGVAWTTKYHSFRVPAPGEVTEFDDDRGWDPAMKKLIEVVEKGEASGKQRAVIDYVTSTSAPPTEVDKDRYILDDSGTPHANWDGASQLDIVEFDGTSWVARTPEEGWEAHVDLQNKTALYTDDGTPAWILGDSADITLDDAYNNGAAGDHIVEVDDGQVIMRLADTESFRVDTGEAGAPIVVTDSDFELSDMSAWVDGGGMNVKDAVEQRSGLRCCSLEGTISQPTVFTIGVETTFGIWAKANTDSQALSVHTSNETIINEVLPNDDTYHYYEAVFTPTATDLILNHSAG